MHQKLTSWPLRGLAVLALTAVIALGIWVHPLHDPVAPNPQATTAAPTPPPSPIRTAAETPRIPTLAATLTPSASPSPTPAFAPTPISGGTVSMTAASSTTTIIQAPIIAANIPLAGRMETNSYLSQVTGREEFYRIYLPPGYDQTDRRYPVLYLFHGWPYDESHWDNLGIDETADTGIQAGTYPPFIIVLPRADPDGVFVTTAGGDNSFEGQVLRDLIPNVEATYRVATERAGRAIGGISRGGVWALEIGLRHPDLFAAVGGHSPALEYNRAPAAYDPFHLLDQPGVAGLRIYLDAGDSDWAFPATQALHEALDARAIPNQFAIHTGSHSDALWGANLAEYLAFYTAEW